MGVGRSSGLVVFLFGALPGEEVTARITKVRRRHAFADTVAVHRRSPERVEPPCPYFGACGGCQLQHLAYQGQVRAKAGVLRNVLNRAGVALPAELEQTGASVEWRYRWRGEFHRSAAGPPLGFKHRSSYEVLGVADCLIHHPAITGSLAAVGEAVSGLGPEVRTVQLTAGGGGSQLLVATRPDTSASASVLVDAAAALPAGPDLTNEATSLEYRGRQFRVFPDSFLQVNQPSLDALYEPVLEFLGAELGGSHVIDAYAGIGILSLRLADLGARVTAIESNPIAARLCQLHAEMYDPAGVKTVCGPVETELARAGAALAVVLDPPRAGLAPEVTAWLSQSGPRTVAY
ncbi:MAG TPA: TRAM domain-containing protein, partial [Candidatus Dormibacteraeota bacterium]